MVTALVMVCIGALIGSPHETMCDALGSAARSSAPAIVCIPARVSWDDRPEKSPWSPGSYRDALSTAFTNACIDKGFDVVDKDALGDVREEQIQAMHGSIQSAIGFGQIKGADYLIIPQITLTGGYSMILGDVKSTVKVEFQGRSSGWRNPGWEDSVALDHRR